jgi:hypothetical protein
MKTYSLDLRQKIVDATSEKAEADLKYAESTLRQSNLELEKWFS